MQRIYAPFNTTVLMIYVPCQFSSNLPCSLNSNPLENLVAYLEVSFLDTLSNKKFQLPLGTY